AMLPTAAPTLVKVALVLVPRVVMAVMHTTMMSASMTAYSTAVGPSSFFRKLTRAELNLRIGKTLSKKRIIEGVATDSLLGPPAPSTGADGSGAAAGRAGGPLRLASYPARREGDGQ